MRAGEHGHAWGLRYAHWPEDEFLHRAFWSRDEAITWAVNLMFDDEAKKNASRKALWRRLRRGELQMECVKVTIVAGWQ